jgi:signal peptidase I
MKVPVRTKVKVVILTAFILALLVRVFILEGFIVRGDSMFPTILSGDYVFINKLAYLNQEPAYGDIIVANPRERDLRVIKRVTGLPGGYIEMGGKRYKLDPQEYFATGDNLTASIDSRELGFFDKWRIKGKVFGVFRLNGFKYISL